MITKQAVLEAIAKWPFSYTTKDGRAVYGDRCSNVSNALREAGWRNVRRLDAYDLKCMGLEIVEAYYSGGCRKGGKMVDVVVLREKEPF